MERNGEIPLIATGPIGPQDLFREPTLQEVDEDVAAVGAMIRNDAAIDRLVEAGVDRNELLYDLCESPEANAAQRRAVIEAHGLNADDFSDCLNFKAL